MAKELDRLMKGTQFAGKAMFKHDALSLMTAKETRLWMQTTFVNGRSIYSRWLLPQAGLNERIEVEGGRFNRRYANRPPGNLPRLMSLDEYICQQCLGGRDKRPRLRDEGPPARAGRT